MNNNILIEISDMKRFVEESENHLRFLLRSFNFYSDINNINSESNLEDIISNIQKHVSQSEATKKMSSECQLPSPIPEEFLEDKKLKYTIDDETRNCILSAVRENGIIPPRATTVDEYMASFSGVEKNILYDHALKNTIKIKTPPELLLPEPEETNIDESKLSEEELHLKKLEIMKKERDMKRRRIAYRKKVSTKNKTLNEVTREMISNIMEALYGKDIDDEETKDEEKDLVRGRDDSQFQDVERRKYEKDFERSYEKHRSERYNSKKDREKSNDDQYNDKDKRKESRYRDIERNRDKRRRSRDDCENKSKEDRSYRHKEKEDSRSYGYKEKEDSRSYWHKEKEDRSYGNKEKEDRSYGHKEKEDSRSYEHKEKEDSRNYGHKEKEDSRSYGHKEKEDRRSYGYKEKNYYERCKSSSREDSKNKEKKKRKKDRQSPL